MNLNFWNSLSATDQFQYAVIGLLFVGLLALDLKKKGK